MNEILVDLYIRSLLLSGLGLVCLWVIRRQTASIRHMVATFATVALLTLPILKVFVPQFLLYWLPTPVSGVRNPLELGHQIPPFQFPNHLATERIESPPFNFWLIMWVTGVAVIAVRHIYGWLIFQSWVRASNPVETTVGKTDVIESSDIKVPLTGWFGKSLIIVPNGWSEWSHDKKEYALLHELAHIRRRDLISQLMGRLACTLFWPNPLVWVLAKQCRNLAEYAADDHVLSHGVPATQYAQALLEIARESWATPPVQSGACVSMAKDSDVARRIEMILSKNTRRGAASPSSLVIAGLVASAFTTPVATLALAQQPVPAARQTSSHPNAQFLIHMCFLKPHVLLTYPGLAKHNLPKGARDQNPGLNSNTFAFEIPSKAAKELNAKWQIQQMIASSPGIRTLSGLNAEIRTTSNDEETSVSILPTYNKDRTIDITMNYQVKRHGSESNHQVTYRTKAGASLLITEIEKNDGPAEVLALLSVDLVTSD